MVDTIFIYYEGDKKLQPGLPPVPRLSLPAGFKIRPVAGGANSIADFITGVKSNRDALNILLKDSEGLSIRGIAN